jgi:hypothetical protein
MIFIGGAIRTSAQAGSLALLSELAQVYQPPKHSHLKCASRLVWFIRETQMLRCFLFAETCVAVGFLLRKLRIRELRCGGLFEGGGFRQFIEEGGVKDGCSELIACGCGVAAVFGEEFVVASGCVNFCPNLANGNDVGVAGGLGGFAVTIGQALLHGFEGVVWIRFRVLLIAVASTPSLEDNGDGSRLADGGGQRFGGGIHRLAALGFGNRGRLALLLQDDDVPFPFGDFFECGFGFGMLRERPAAFGDLLDFDFFTLAGGQLLEGLRDFETVAVADKKNAEWLG